MSSHWPEFARIVIVHLLAVASPGPDFFLVLKQALRHGRRAALWTAVGVSTPIFLHVAYSLFGVTLLMEVAPSSIGVLRIAGGAYLGWIGIRSLLARTPATVDAPADTGGSPARTAWTQGVLTNALNPKVVLFFVALFATLVSPDTPMAYRIGYGIWVSAATLAWFCIVALVLTRQGIRERFLRLGLWIDRGLGVVFLALAVALLLTSPTKQANPSYTSLSTRINR